jgi:DNA-binding PadR family transcriptional regulator
MSVARTLLGLLEAGSSHGYELKREHDRLLRPERPLAYGQVYATLARLLRDGLVTVDAVEPGEGPERKRYVITEAGVTDVSVWLRSPEPAASFLQNTVYVKVMLALLSGRSAQEVLDAQRREHLGLMRDLQRRKKVGDLAESVICDHALFHLAADLKWLEATETRLDELARIARMPE